MDWPKIKNVLIVLLIATNLMLGFIIIEDQALYRQANASNLQDILQLYDENEITLMQDEFDFPDEIASIQLDFERIPETMVSDLLGPGFMYDGEKYTWDDEIVILHEMEILWSKQAHYSRVSSDDEQNLRWFEPVTDPDALKETMEIINAFKLANGFDSEFEKIEVKALGHYQIVTMKHMRNNLVIEEAKVIYWVHDGEVVGFKKSWPVNIGSSDVTNYDIISVDRALYSVMVNFKAGDSIQGITIVYKLNDQSFQVSDLISGEALPYYRFMTDQGKIFYVQAVETP
jgi:regulatory protein YycI of two-component signal transduction system YycFG